MRTSLITKIAILAPVGADATNAASVLASAGIPAEISPDIGSLCEGLLGDSGGAIIGEEALGESSLQLLRATLSKQPAWSDIPLIIILKSGSKLENNAKIFRALAADCNVAILERPLRSLILISAIQAALRSRARQFQVRDLLEQRDSILSSIQDAFVTVDRDWKFTYVNDRAADLADHTKEKLLGMRLEAGFPEVRHPDLQTKLSQAMSDQKFLHAELFSPRKGLWFEYRVYPSPHGLSVVITDITARKQSEASLQRQAHELEAMSNDLKAAQQRLSKHAEDLERRVAERTASLKASIESLEGVCYTIAHDLRAPLRAMQGFTQALVESNHDRFNEEEKDYARRIITAATSMDALINDLLDYAKLSNQDLPCVEIDLNEKLAAILQEMDSEIRQCGAEIKVGPLPKVWGNETMLGQIFSNLLSNALKFVRPGTTPEIEIFSSNSSGSIQICVQDNGIGIAPEHHERVFGVFQRLHRSNQYPGTGIGLAIVRKGIERMGGKVNVRSELGKGCCFSIELPERRTTS